MASAGLILMILTGLGTAGLYIVHHSSAQITTDDGHDPDGSTSDLYARADWFQRTHLGQKTPPTPDARMKALRQAAALPTWSYANPSIYSALAKVPAGALQNSLAGTLGGSWVSLGPAPYTVSSPYASINNGRIAALAVNPTNGNEVWLGAAGGGVWHSLDGGATWTPVTDNQASLATGAIAVDPNHPSTVYIGTGEGNMSSDEYASVGILKSVDDGATWTQLGFTQFGGYGITKLVVDPANSSVVLAGVTYGYQATVLNPNSGYANQWGIWRSTDGGTTWSQVLGNTGTFDFGSDLAFDPSHPGVVFAALSSAGGYRANDTAAGVYKSTDGGATWSQLTNGLPSGALVGRTALSVSQDGSHLYVAMTDTGGASGTTTDELLNGSIYVSTDGGSSWTAKSVAGVPGMVNDDNGKQWWYDIFSATDPTNSNVAYIGGIDIWQTKDGGSTWTNITNSYALAGEGTPAGVHPDQHALAFLPGSASFYDGNDGGVWKGAASGNPATITFTSLNHGGLSTIQFYGGGVGDAGTSPTLYGGSQDNGMIAYPAGGVPGSQAQWNIALGGDQAGVAVDYTNSANVYIDDIFGNYSKSTNGGANWAAVTNGLPSGQADGGNWYTPLIMSPTTPSTIYTVKGAIYRTTDSESSWSAIGGPWTYNNGGNMDSIYIGAMAIAPSNANDLFAMGSTNTADELFTTTNATAATPTWTQVAFTSPNTDFYCPSALAVDPSTPTTLYATFCGFSFNPSGIGGHVLKSTDGGHTWTDVSNALPNVPFESVIVDPHNSNIVIAASDAGIFASPDAGATWYQAGTGLPNVTIDQMFTDHNGTGIYVATHGRGMWKLAPTFQVTPASINLTTAPGVSPASQTITIKNNSGFTSGGGLSWKISSTLPTWLSASATTGSLAPGASGTVTLSFNIASTTPQTYSTKLVIGDATNAGNPPISVPVTVVATPGALNWYFAEGYTGGDATEYLTIANPDPVNTAQVQVRYLLGSGGPIVKDYTVGPSARFTQVVNQDVGPNQNVSMVVTSTNGVPIVVERPYYVTYVGSFGKLPSGTDVRGATALSSQFDFANVDSSPGHDTWFTILNNNSSAMDVAISYFPQAGGTPTTIHHAVPGNSRGTVAVQYELGLARADYSATITLSEPGLVERTLYEQADSVTGYPGAADVIGVAAPQTSWDFAEGYSSPSVNERYVLSNPSTSLTAHATVTFYLADGSAHPSGVQTLSPGQQVTVAAAPLIGATGVNNSAIVTSDNPILAERLMSSIYNGSAGCCYHTISAPGLSEVLGASASGHLFEFAEGYTGGQVAEYLTILNPDPSNTATVTISFLPANGNPPTVLDEAIGPHTRFTLYTNSVMHGTFFAMTVESNVPILAERPMSFIYNSFAPGSTDIIGYQPPGS